jgi:hypothetical protein
VEGAEVGYRMHVAAPRALGHVTQLHVIEHALPQRRDCLRLCHGDLLSVGLSKPGDPGRRRMAAYGLKYSSKDAKGRKSNLVRHLDMALLSHSLLFVVYEAVCVSVHPLVELT